MLPVVITLFLGVVQVIGGVLLGLGARNLPVFAGGDAQSSRAGWGNPYSPVLAGAIFAGGGLLMAVVVLLPINRAYFVADLLALAAALLAGAFLPRPFLEKYGLGTIVPVGLGSFAIVVGVLVAIEAANRGQMAFGLAWAGIMGVVGLGFLNAGLRSVLPPKGRE